MYSIPPFVEHEPRVVLHFRDTVDFGPYKRVYETVEDLVLNNSIQWIRENVGIYFGRQIKVVTQRASGFGGFHPETRKIIYTRPEISYWAHPTCIVRNEYGDVITVEDLERAAWRVRLRGYRWHRYRGSRAQVYGQFRSPKTTQERRYSVHVDFEEGEPPYRARRNFANLANAWNDVMTSPQKSWKWQSKRRRQWRAK